VHGSDADYTFVFTDIEGSTRLWLDHPANASAAISLHDQILTEVFEQAGGRVVKNLGDGLMAVFPDPVGAIEATVAGQRELSAHEGELRGAASVRMAVHSGGAEERGGDLIGLEVNRAQRIMASAHGGQILVSSATAALIAHRRPEALTLVDLGRYRLPGLDEPQHIYQLTGPRLRREFPPLDSPTTDTHNLPAELSSFVGRTQELAELDKLLHASRLVTLTGEGGIGKTRLALRVASMLRGHFRDGIWAIDLSAITDDTMVARQAASSLGIRSTTDGSMLETVVTHLVPLNALLVLDNCEHVLSGVVEFVEDLLTRGPEVSVVATSRERIGIPGEVVHRVPPMPFPDSTVSSTVATRYDAVRLFVERAALVAPGFRLTDDNVHHVAGVCRHLDGLPLAIELAAAKSATLTPEDIVNGLANTLDLLDRSARDRGRHRTLRAAARWSFDLLSTSDQHLFATLSVFRGGFDSDAAGVVAEKGKAQVLAGLSSLADKSLIRRADDSKRFRMLEPLRAFAVERLETGDGTHARSRHARFYAELADRAYEARESAELGAWLDQLDRDQDNLHAALEWASASGHSEVALRIAIGTTVLWKQRGQGAEGRRRLERALTDNKAPARLRARAHLAAGDLAADIGEIGAARSHLDTAHQLAQDLDDAHTAARSLARLASIPHKEGDLETACVLFEEALGAARRDGDDLVLSHVLASLSLVVADRGGVERATQLATESVERSRATGNAYAMADALLAVGEIGLNHGDAAAARTRVEEALQIGTREGLGAVIAWSLAYLGRASLLDGEIQAARVILEKAVEEFDRVGMPMGRPWTLRHLALVHWWTGDEGAAEATLQRALADAVVYVRPEAPLLVEVYGWLLAGIAPRAAALLLGCASAHLRQMGLELPPFEAAHAAAARRTLAEGISGEDLTDLFETGARSSLTDAARRAANRQN
jgi:predicted ATPase/class 3 adenylate cyclase